ncbi:hypothetical protein O0I10_009740 [Lichtheimia ornata]|uniref:Major facilitator superfamily (MFS) profile domain-containing protein n=1 Tax=Lichtheimia ornata TaxID=688661 RepID=A0AAD7UVU5_9FUNG|nr:uncharacterized protein O0I10_009740 [Lichtheimia ornata]KAJ8654558.1 hypothetical protein O0I10_009740 [Lichtheimia ornata]
MDPKQPDPTTITTTTPPKALEAGEQKAVIDNAEQAEEEYTVFSKPRRMFIAVIVSFAGLLSPFSSTVYYPALTEINKEFDVSTTLVNVSVSVYMIFQALTPSFWGSLADIWGRRPVYISTEILYVGICAGLANAPSFPALLVLRMFQAAGASSAIALGAGVLGDTIVPAERGAYFSAFTCCQMMATSLGPVIGGAIAQTLSWRWIFYVLMIIGGVALVAVFFFLPETLRSLVGNGSGYANPTPTQWLRKKALQQENNNDAAAAAAVKEPSLSRFLKFPRVWQPFLYLLQPDVAFMMISNGLVAAMLAVYMTTTPTHFEAIYGLDELQVGLCYLPFGGGCVLASFMQGRILNRDFRAVARKLGYTSPEKLKSGNLPADFPIFKARLRTIWVQILLLQAVTVCYGWVLYKEVHLAAPLILQFIAGYAITCGVTVYQTLSVDLYPGKGATIGATNNIVRSLLGAAGTACVEPGIEGIGIGWMFTVLGLILFVSSGLVPIMIALGPKWWRRRCERREAKEQQKK